jgi:hypothetical protein
MTTQPSITEAMLEKPLTRGAMAKMLIEFTKRHFEDEMSNERVCSFEDLTTSDEETQYYAKKACELGIMGITPTGEALGKFNPNGEVTRAQTASAISRLLW